MSRSGSYEMRMDAPTIRVFTAARIVALSLIALLVAGLTYLRFAPDSGSVLVPAGAQAGDLLLSSCSYATENGAYDADCGTLVVPENRANPGSRLIALPITRIRARSDHPAEPIFRLEGGPGITNMKFKNASRFADDRDVVLVGYRGVDGSSVLDCPEVVSALKHSTDLLGEKSLRAYAEALRSCANRLTQDGVDLAGYGIAQQVDDLEAARTALGYGRIDLVSESAGTRTAMIYAWRYPRSIHRSVMIGVNPPGHFLWDAKTTDEEIGRYAALCASDDSCSWWLLPIKEGNVRVVTFFGLLESTSEATPFSAPSTLDSWLSAADGDASGFWLLSLAGDLLFPRSFVWGEYSAFGLADAQAARAYFSSGRHKRDSILGDPGTDFAWAGGGLTDAWPAAPDAGEYNRVRTTAVETLLIGGTLDFSTPPQVATKELLPHLPNGHQVVLAELGHSGSFWSYQSEAGSRLINTFFDSGRVDDSLYKPATIDFTPEATFTALAKRIAGTMVGLALLAVLSLLWMARRVHKRGAFGPKAGATLRSLYPVVLGLGGWLLGALIVITTRPDIPLDDELLVALSVGMPIGLGTYFAWVNRAWSVKTKATGFAAAAGGALVGAWLGFNATADLLALVTAIVGAAVGANLTLIALDITWDRSNHSRLAAVGPPPEAAVESPAQLRREDPGAHNRSRATARAATPRGPGRRPRRPATATLARAQDSIPGAGSPAWWCDVRVEVGWVPLRGRPRRVRRRTVGSRARRGRSGGASSHRECGEQTASAG